MLRCMERFGPYEAMEALGRGGLGVVYRAVDTRTREEVALKVLLGADASAHRRLVLEARALTKLRHRNVVDVEVREGAGQVSALLPHRGPVRASARVEDRQSPTTFALARRGVVKLGLRDTVGAAADLERALALEPGAEWAPSARGALATARRDQ